MDIVLLYSGVHVSVNMQYGGVISGLCLAGRHHMTSRRLTYHSIAGKQPSHVNRPGYTSTAIPC